ncbi:MAG: CrcB family protein [Bdellovibrionales bacterium]
MSMIIVAAAAGSLIRWQVGMSLWGVLLVNSAGSFLAGVIAGMNKPENPWQTALLVGFCGSLTTFSGYALWSVRLWEQGEIFKMLWSFCLNNAMCLLLCYGGWQLAHRI